MIWFDPTAMFTRQFEPTDGGFLFYPRPKGPGKLITPAEYESMLSDYRRWVGGRFRPGLMLAVLFAAILVMAIVSVFLNLSPEQTGWIGAPLALMGLGFLFWLQRAPHRLVRGRPDAVPPRTKEELGHAGRRMMPWPMVIFGTGLSGLLALVALTAQPSIEVVMWTLLWAAVFVAYLRIAIQKFYDAKR